MGSCTYLKARNVWTWTCGSDDHPLFKNIAKIRNVILDKNGSQAAAITLLRSWAPHGSLSTSMAYNWLRGKEKGKTWMPLIWRSYIPPKFSFILWLSLRGRLYTKNKWIVNQDRKCSLCKTSTETIEHLFFCCTFVRAVWAKVRCWLGINREMTTLLSVIKRIKKDFRGALIKSKVVVIALASTVYFIWKMRNEATFTNKATDVSFVFSTIQYNVYSIIYSLYPVEVVDI